MLRLLERWHRGAAEEKKSVGEEDAAAAEALAAPEEEDGEGQRCRRRSSSSSSGDPLRRYSGSSNSSLSESSNAFDSCTSEDSHCLCRRSGSRSSGIKRRRSSKSSSNAPALVSPTAAQSHLFYSPRSSCTGVSAAEAPAAASSTIAHSQQQTFWLHSSPSSSKSSQHSSSSSERSSRYSSTGRSSGIVEQQYGCTSKNQVSSQSLGLRRRRREKKKRTKNSSSTLEDRMSGSSAFSVEGARHTQHEKRSDSDEKIETRALAGAAASCEGSRENSSSSALSFFSSPVFSAVHPYASVTVARVDRRFLSLTLQQQHGFSSSARQTAAAEHAAHQPQQRTADLQERLHPTTALHLPQQQQPKQHQDHNEHQQSLTSTNSAVATPAAAVQQQIPSLWRDTDFHDFGTLQQQTRSLNRSSGYTARKRISQTPSDVKDPSADGGVLSSAISLEKKFPVLHLAFTSDTVAHAAVASASGAAAPSHVADQFAVPDSAPRTAVTAVAPPTATAAAKNAGGCRCLRDSEQLSAGAAAAAQTERRIAGSAVPLPKTPAGAAAATEVAPIFFTCKESPTAQDSTAVTSEAAAFAAEAENAGAAAYSASMLSSGIRRHTRKAAAAASKDNVNATVAPASAAAQAAAAADAPAAAPAAVFPAARAKQFGEIPGECTVASETATTATSASDVVPSAAAEVASFSFPYLPCAGRRLPFSSSLSAVAAVHSCAFQPFPAASCLGAARSEAAANDLAISYRTAAFIVPSSSPSLPPLSSATTTGKLSSAAAEGAAAAAAWIVADSTASAVASCTVSSPLAPPLLIATVPSARPPTTGLSPVPVAGSSAASAAATAASFATPSSLPEEKIRVRAAAKARLPTAKNYEGFASPVAAALAAAAPPTATTTAPTAAAAAPAAAAAAPTAASALTVGGGTATSGGATAATGNTGGAIFAEAPAAAEWQASRATAPGVPSARAAARNIEETFTAAASSCASAAAHAVLRGKEWKMKPLSLLHKGQQQLHWEVKQQQQHTLLREQQQWQQVNWRDQQREGKVEATAAGATAAEAAEREQTRRTPDLAATSHLGVATRAVAPAAADEVEGVVQLIRESEEEQAAAAADAGAADAEAGSVGSREVKAAETLTNEDAAENIATGSIKCVGEVLKNGSDRSSSSEGDLCPSQDAVYMSSSHPPAAAGATALGVAAVDAVTRRAVASSAAVTAAVAGAPMPSAAIIEGAINAAADAVSAFPFSSLTGAVAAAAEAPTACMESSPKAWIPIVFRVFDARRDALCPACRRKQQLLQQQYHQRQHRGLQVCSFGSSSSFYHSNRSSQRSRNLSSSSSRYTSRYINCSRRRPVCTWTSRSSTDETFPLKGSGRIANEKLLLDPRFFDCEDLQEVGEKEEQQQQGQSQQQGQLKQQQQEPHLLTITKLDTWEHGGGEGAAAAAAREDSGAAARGRSKEAAATEGEAGATDTPRKAARMCDVAEVAAAGDYAAVTAAGHAMQPLHMRPQQRRHFTAEEDVAGVPLSTEASSGKEEEETGYYRPLPPAVKDEDGEEAGKNCFCDCLYVVGNHRLLGWWGETGRGVTLTTSPSLYPYYISAPVLLPRHMGVVQYKFSQQISTRPSGASSFHSSAASSSWFNPAAPAAAAEELLCRIGAGKTGENEPLDQQLEQQQQQRQQQQGKEQRQQEHEKEARSRGEKGEAAWQVERIDGERRLKLPHAAVIISHTFGVNDRGTLRQATHKDLKDALALCTGHEDWNLPVFANGGLWYNIESCSSSNGSSRNSSSSSDSNSGMSAATANEKNRYAWKVRGNSGRGRDGRTGQAAGAGAVAQALLRLLSPCRWIRYFLLLHQSECTAATAGAVPTCERSSSPETPQSNISRSTKQNSSNLDSSNVHVQRSSIERSSRTQGNRRENTDSSNWQSNNTTMQESRSRSVEKVSSSIAVVRWSGTQQLLQQHLLQAFNSNCSSAAVEPQKKNNAGTQENETEKEIACRISAVIEGIALLLQTGLDVYTAVEGAAGYDSSSNNGNTVLKQQRQQLKQQQLHRAQSSTTGLEQHQQHITLQLSSRTNSYACVFPLSVFSTRL